jgi:hypothetical protein
MKSVMKTEAIKTKNKPAFLKIKKGEFIQEKS